eukprot:14269890-Alexandrium_andersonii.AAC.1
MQQHSNMRAPVSVAAPALQNESNVNTHAHDRWMLKLPPVQGQKGARRPNLTPSANQPGLRPRARQMSCRTGTSCSRRTVGTCTWSS